MVSYHSAIRLVRKLTTERDVWSILLWDKFFKGEQTYLQLSIKWECSIKTIQRRTYKHIIRFDRL